MSRKADLRADVRARAENRPGVYRMLGPGDEVLYVGKSVRLRTRLLSYFRARRGQKAAEIIGHAHRIDWDYAPSEFAAVLEELKQIKRWRPPYNVEHKRDRSYCFAKLTREAAPRLLVASTLARDGALYFGPFRGRKRVREALREISDLLELRDCAGPVPMRFADQIDIFGTRPAPRCMRVELARCLGPCAARCTQDEYRDRVDLARRFLEGDADRPLAILRERMVEAAGRMQFEYAATLRDRAERLETVRQEVVALQGALESLSFLYAVPGFAGEDRLYLIQRGAPRAEFDMPGSPLEWDRVHSLVHDSLELLDPSPVVVQPHLVPEILLIARWFRLRPGERARTFAPAARTDLREIA